MLSIIPISLAFHFAHYLAVLLINGQYALVAASESFSQAFDLLGGADYQVTGAWLTDHHSVALLWKLQAGAIVGGHILAVVHAHALALKRYGHTRWRGDESGAFDGAHGCLYSVRALAASHACRGIEEKMKKGSAEDAKRGDEVMTAHGQVSRVDPLGGLTRRRILTGIGAVAGLAAGRRLTPRWGGGAQAATSAPIKIGFQAHRTGIGAAYGRWYERVTHAAVKLINAGGGIAGRPVELITEDDGTDPKRGAEVVEKMATLHRVDVTFGTLFSHVVLGSAPRAGELKMPYFVVSEGYHVASTKLNRYVFQPGITDVRSQVISMAPWVSNHLGKKVTMIFPDYAFGHDHRDFFSTAMAAQGGEVIEKIAIPPTERSFTKYLPKIPRQTDVLYHVMVGPGVLTFVKELGEFFGSTHPAIFGFVDSLEAVDIATPGLEFLEGSYFWEAHPRYMSADAPESETFYRDAVGVNREGASVSDPKDISTYSHMFGCWETLFVLKEAIEASGYQSPTPADKQKLLEAVEAMTTFAAGREHPQGDKLFNGKLHQSFGHQYISKVEGAKLKPVHRTAIEDGLYEPAGDYTTQSF